MVSPICAHTRSLGLGGFAVFLRFARTSGSHGGAAVSPGPFCTSLDRSVAGSQHIFGFAFGLSRALERVIRLDVDDE